MKRRNVLFLVFFLVVLGNVVVWWFVVCDNTVLSVTFLDVGQGDSILIEGPTGIQVLIDAGKDRSVLRELGEEMGPLDRTIDMVIATHPDADHIGGLPAVFATYRIHTYLSSGVESDTNPTLALKGSILEEAGVQQKILSRGDYLSLGGGAYAYVLFPDRTLPAVETNTGSVVLRVVYGETSFLLTGDAPDEIEEWLVQLDDQLKSNVLKAGHHGSKTSTSQSFIETVDPDVVVVSAGKGNSYGHPHQEVVDRIISSGAVLRSTAEEGTIRFESDGKRLLAK